MGVGQAHEGGSSWQWTRSRHARRNWPRRPYWFGSSSRTTPRRPLVGVRHTMATPSVIPARSAGSPSSLTRRCWRAIRPLAAAFRSSRRPTCGRRGPRSRGHGLPAPLLGHALLAVRARHLTATCRRRRQLGLDPAPGARPPTGRHRCIHDRRVNDTPVIFRNADSASPQTSASRPLVTPSCPHPSESPGYGGIGVRASGAVIPRPVVPSLDRSVPRRRARRRGTTPRPGSVGCFDDRDC